jgi:hypothetical protein
VQNYQDVVVIFRNVDGMQIYTPGETFCPAADSLSVRTMEESPSMPNHATAATSVALAVVNSEVFMH